MAFSGFFVLDGFGFWCFGLGVSGYFGDYLLILGGFPVVVCGFLTMFWVVFWLFWLLSGYFGVYVCFGVSGGVWMLPAIFGAFSIYIWFSCLFCILVFAGYCSRFGLWGLFCSGLCLFCDFITWFVFSVLWVLCGIGFVGGLRIFGLSSGLTVYDFVL